MSQYIIGLTGGIGSGKSAASDHFEKLGISVIDADIVAREIVEPGTDGLSKIKEHFGENILLESGDLNRAQLRERIFSNAEEKAWLENLLHPIIREEIIRQLSEAESGYAMLVSPLLFETKQYQLANRTLLIDATVEEQIARASNRDDVSTEQIEKIIASQMSRECKSDKADDIIMNDKDLVHLHTEVERLHQYYLELSREFKEPTRS